MAVKQLINERWLVTFADLMSILFALFVLINSFSEIDAESFKQNAGPMSQAFNGNVQSSDITYEGKKVEKEKIVVKEVIEKEAVQTFDVEEKTSSDLSNKAKNGLDQIIDVLPYISGEIVIVGHTDDIPIQSFQFPSNWALSSSRASAVASYIILNSNIKKTRISVVGKAETQPISKSKEENRRIELKIKVRPN